MAKHGVPGSHWGLGIIWVLRAVCVNVTYRIVKEDRMVRVQEQYCTYIQQVVQQLPHPFPDKYDMLELYPHDKRQNV
jgi:hypothetical protein